MAAGPVGIPISRRSVGDSVQPQSEDYPSAAVAGVGAAAVVAPQAAGGAYQSQRALTAAAEPSRSQPSSWA
jgi:hypothetical protein